MIIIINHNNLISL